jgi:hypothetical protein
MYAGETQKLYMPHRTAEWTEWCRDVAPCQGCGVGLNLLSVVGSLRFRYENYLIIIAQLLQN